MLAEMSKLFGLLPHEWALGRRDQNGDDMELDLIVFDLQCAMAYGKEREQADKNARRKRRR